MLRLSSLTRWLRGGLNKWRVAFFVFAFSYGALLLVNISYNSIMWDEVTHLTGGMYLLRGDFSSYFAFNAFYPPMFDLFTAAFFSIGGITVFSGRLVSVVFSFLSLYAVFEFTCRLYEPKIGLLASIFLGIMPGFVWLSRLAMIETMLIFFFTLSVLFFFMWLQNGKLAALLLSGLTLGVGILTKYQVIIGLAIMLTGLLILDRGYLKSKLTRFPLILLTTFAVVVPWVLASYQLYASGMLDAWFYAATIGNPDKSLYSIGLNSAGGNRLPHFYIEIPSWLQLPIFYFLEMTEPYFNVHPISLLPYLLGLGGIAMFMWRRKAADKYLLIWFFLVYVFFTIIPNRHWRYVVPLFPVLAISAACFLTYSLSIGKSIFKNKHLSPKEKHFALIPAVFLIAFTLVGVGFSVEQSYAWVQRSQVRIPIQEASNYVATNIREGESVAVLCPQDMFSQDIVRFYIEAQGKNVYVWQYPQEPVDTYTPHFNATELVNLCRERNAKYVLLYEFSDAFGDNLTYFNSTLTFRDVYIMMSETGSFSAFDREGSREFGPYPPKRIFSFTFLG